MLSTILLASLLPFIAALPSPVAQPEAAAAAAPVTSPSPSVTPIGKEYYLKTESNTTSKNNLFLSAYHTGAGLNDAGMSNPTPTPTARPQLTPPPPPLAVLIPVKSTTPGSYNTTTFPPIKGFLNSTSTSQEFDLGNPFPYSLDPQGGASYAAWNPVVINAGESLSGGFYFNNTDGSGTVGLKWVSGWPYSLAGDPEQEFGGWLACDWVHGLPQLFWLENEQLSSSAPLPCSCAKVELVRQFLS
ncbi:hypothetical protein MMC19_001895 [Ptychographa xylographoides]|nr:hypothetical protein [Ptychographa xylographoides]